VVFVCVCVCVCNHYAIKKLEQIKALVTWDIGESYFSKARDAAKQDCATLPCQFSHHALYQLPQMSTRKNGETIKLQKM